MPPIQENRVAAIATPLGEDKLVLKSLTGTEELGRLFQFELELLSDDVNLAFEDIIGRNVTIRLNLADDQIRYFNGYVSRFVQTTHQGEYARYLATMVPWLWFLTRNADCRIFQDQTVPEILEDVFKRHEFDAYELRLSGNYRKWTYCVQYRETDFNFVARLMEQEGIYYYFRHEDGKHTLVLSDSPSSHDDGPGYEEIVFRPPEGTGSSTECIRDWTIQKQLQTNTYAHADFNFEKSRTKLASNSSVPRDHTAAHFEVFDYPGEYGEAGEGDEYAKIRIDEIQSRYEILHGQSDARGLAAGFTFTLKDFPRDDQNRKYLVLSVAHSLEVDLFESGAGGAGRLYDCSFAAADAQQPFRPQRLTPKPVVQGPQTAMVVGPQGEEIHTDKFGRIKVQFHWDRYGKADDHSSCWIRVAHAWAGKNWGVIYTPRIGQEVIVEFLEGDPDRPIVTGRVYNDDCLPPYPLPDHATLSTLKSNSSKGGGGFNEIRFEDKKGDEQIFIHGEKNLDIRIKNSSFESVGYERHLHVKKDQFEHVENNRHEIVDADHMEKIGKDRHLKVDGKEAKAVEGSLALTVKGDVAEAFDANHSEKVGGDYYLKASNIVIEATSNLTLKVGGTSIAMEAGGIGIKTDGQLKIQTTGPAEIKATGPLALESSATADLKGVKTTVAADTMTEVKGSVMVQIQGGLVKIN